MQAIMSSDDLKETSDKRTKSSPDCGGAAAPESTSCFGSSKRLGMAKLRWKMLSRALHEGSPSALQSDIAPAGSIRQFSSFNLIRLIPKQTNNSESSDSFYPDEENKEHSTSDSKLVSTDEKGTWFDCCCKEIPSFHLDVRVLAARIPMKELLHGFDNTGNIMIWPSEEILGYYCLKNSELCNQKVVCELGGGMVCLAGLIAAVSSNAKRVILTDGNKRSLDNFSDVVQMNAHRFGQTLVSCRQLRWGLEKDLKDLVGKIDVILCSDCLYFDDGRKPLVDTIWDLLQNTGLAVILAPQRGNTFQDFVSLAKQRFVTEQVMVYDTTVWEVHEELLRSSIQPHVYQPELHYPKMIVLKKDLESLKN